MNVVGRYVAIIIAVLLVILFPLQYIAQSQEETMADIVNVKATEFTDTARHLGYITKDMYEDLIDELDQTGEIYDITIEASHPVSGKEVTQNSLGDTIPDIDTVNTLFTGNTATADFVSSGSITLFATGHVHTADCYVGHNHAASVCTYHTHTGNSSTYGGCYTVRVDTPYSYSCTRCDGSGRKSCPGGSTRTDSQYYSNGATYCSICKIWPSATVTWTKCNICGATLVTTKVWSDSHLGSTTSYGSHTSISCSSCGGDGVVSGSTTSYSLGCGLSAGYNCGYSTNDTTPKCNLVVTSITATNPTQSVDVGGSIVTSATATYLDGHTATVSCTSNFKSNVIGTQTVTLTYSGLVGNARTTGTRTCTISVTVKEPTPSSLTVIPSSYSVYNGKQPSYTVSVNYAGGSTKELTPSQYTVTGWSAGAGNKTLTFTYTEQSITLTKSIIINVLPNLTSIKATPSTQEIARYNNPNISVTAHYEDNSDKVILNGYSITGFNASNLGTQTVTISYTENNITKTTSVSVTVKRISVTCPICGTVYQLDENDFDQGCPVCSAKAVSILVMPRDVTVQKGQPLPITVTATFQNGTTAPVTGWTSDFDPNILGYQNVTISFQGKTALITVNTVLKRTCPVCHLEYSLNDDGTDPGCPTCSKEVTRIEVAENEVRVERHSQLPITVVATYRDGHTAVVTDWTSDLVTDMVGTFDATIYYKSFTDHVTVNIFDESMVTCPICGLDYSLTDNPMGCPVCSITLTGIEASLRNGGTQVLYKSQLNLQVVLIYKDNHRKLTYTGYTVSGYSPDTLGNQTVTVTYAGFSTTISIEVIAGPPKVTCPNGHEYYLNEDGSDPGCPICGQASSQDNAIFYFNTTYTNDILDALYTEGIYHMEKGDYLTVTVTQRDTSIRSKMKKMFFTTNAGISKKRFTFSGEVL